MHSPAYYCARPFVEGLMRAHAPQRQLRVLDVQPLPVDSSASILAVLTAGQTSRPVGHFGLQVTFEMDGQPARTERMVLKLKPPGHEVSAMLAGLAQACEGELAQAYPAFATRSGFHHTHHRELALYAHHADAALMPRIWGLHQDDETAEVYAILMEYLGEEVELLNTVMQPETWTDAHLRAALDELAAWHARHLLPAGTDTAPVTWPDLPSAAYMQQLTPLWQALLANAAQHHPGLYGPERAELLREAIARIPEYWAELAAAPRTLIHNDLNPRNTCFRRADGRLQLCAYDWELATYHVPQYDVVELLSFVLDADRYHLRPHYLEYYRQQLHARTGRFADADAFRRVTGLAALDFGLHRLGMYLMAHTVGPYPYLPRVVDSYFDTLAQLQPLRPEPAYA
ncbi:aminoglycoside phosphotransferase family protein [Hymenobacter jeollabukensis]|uniref:Aminoglycoside phosphotransferase family protein n=1 Tax=Hymenobacter jeollabukensis TaxID=2025313 RepID=A0A5R8WK18_9BACT|nr:aminoglycoside phosphotransferase family protein [Hymenobacter jeollabukensis]TLM89186.1 aminoglycoside phosphotransferase family protein [Hymenobacter jeollabukensis]